MFFMIGITQGTKDFDYRQMVICNHCGAYGNYRVFMTYMCLSLFFIPCFKWNRQYYVQSSCCNTIYSLDADVGRAIARGEDVEIRPEHLTQVQAGHGSRSKKCSGCGYETHEEFDYCPKCGRRL
ncbi:MAG: zinc ribbon domain-containing protein [Eubacteriales bacterium]|nr:zinc ribbon domain-containing protein [Eubacteriales bacterium]